jgi:hypothetical protein
METNWEVDIQLHAIVASALDGDKRSASHPGSLPSNTGPGTDWVEAGWDPAPVWMLWKRKKCEYLYLAGNITSIHWSFN